MNEAELLIEYAKAWNNLDTSYLETILDDDFQYNSQWVMDTINGKYNYLEYLSGKFKSILKDPTATPKAEIAFFRNAYFEKNKPCLILSQRDKEVSILIQIKNGKIIKADLVGVPDAREAIKLNHFPT